MSWFPLKLDNFSVSIARESDATDLQALFESDPAYALLVEGQLPGPHAGEEAIEDKPDGFELDELAKLIVRDGKGRIAAFVDLLRHYPHKGVLWLGLILVAPHARGGFGTQLMQTLHVTASQCGFDAMQLGAVEGNQAQRLYARLGYREIRRALRKGEDGKARTVIVLEKLL